MVSSPARYGIAIGLFVLLVVAFGPAAMAAVVAPDLAAELARRAPEDEIAVIVSLSDRVDPRPYRKKDRRRRDTELVRALKAKSAATQGPHRTYLRGQGARRLRELWAINGMAATLKVGAIRRLATRPGIAGIRLDSALQAPATGAVGAAAPEWNLNLVNAPNLWSLGHTGIGVVVANMDTGVDADHPDLTTRWRGGGNSWYDPHGQHAMPHDSSGHGTQTMAIMVGGGAGGSAIGMAPDARWIAVKLYDDTGWASYSDIHLAFQWLLDPDGDPNTLDAPDVVNASWGLAGSAGICDTEFGADIEALENAGIALVFAAGNDGPAPQTSLSPANNPRAFSTGAVDAALTVADFSSRGASACDGGIFPKLVAPGVGIRTADLSFGGLALYAAATGTSYAAPHVAGAMALLAGAFPAATFVEIEAALTLGARDLGMAGADNGYGHGLVDVAAAYNLLLAGTGSPPIIVSTPPTGATEGVPYGYDVVARDDDGDVLSYALDTAPTGMSIDAGTGAIAWLPDSAQLGTHAVVVRVTDARGLSATQSFGLVVAAANTAPVAMNDAYVMIAGTTLDVAAAGVLANDVDAEGDALSTVMRRRPAYGSLSLNRDGSFSYTANAGFVGYDHFTYRASDGAHLSRIAFVTIRVKANKAPVARNDSVAVAAWPVGAATYAANRIAVLANDSDRENQLDPAGIRITTAPGRGGTVQANPDGTVGYTPRQGFAGSERFSYQVSDRSGAVSNIATVTVTSVMEPAI